MPGDNFHVEVQSEGREHFEAAVRMAWANAPGGKATHYVCGLPERPCVHCSGSGKNYYPGSIETQCKRCGGSGCKQAESAMVLFWSQDSIGKEKAIPLPFALTFDAAVGFLWSWLESADFGKEPDHDGSNGKGFIVTTGNFWGHVEGSHYAFVGVYPQWQMYGK